MIAKFARLEFELFTRPSKSGFLRVYQYLFPTPACCLGLKYLEFDRSVKGIIKQIQDTMLLTVGTVINAVEQSVPPEHDGCLMIRINLPYGHAARQGAANP